MADIRNLIDTLAAEISAPSFFTETTFAQKTGFGEREQPAFHMTKDGFTLLVMGFTGSRAMAFKLAYIQRFNEMEALLKQPEVKEVVNRVAPTFFKIERGVPIPTRQRAPRYPFDSLEVGESFFVPDGYYKSKHGTQQAVLRLTESPFPFFGCPYTRKQLSSL